MSLNLLLLPSTNPELIGLDIANLTAAISFFYPLQKEGNISLYISMSVSINSGTLLNRPVRQGILL